jgi:hypothetical protein
MVRTTICEHCLNNIKFKNNEIFKTRGRYCIECPICGALVLVDKNDYEDETVDILEDLKRRESF